MRVFHRIRVEGTSEAADRLRVMLAKCSFILVPDSSAAVTIELDEGPMLALDSVDSPLEARIEANLEELHARFPGAGEYLKKRAGGNRDPQRCVVTVPPTLHEAVALAILRAIVQVSEQVVPEEPAPTPTTVARGIVQASEQVIVEPPAPVATKPWWKFFAVLFALLPALASAQQTAPFQQIDVDTDAAVSRRVFVGLFTPASGGAASVALPTTLDGGGFRVTQQGAVTVTDGAGAMNVICDSGCAGSGGTSAVDNSVFTGGTTSVTPMGAIFDATPPAITDGNVGVPRMSTNRILFVDCQVGCSGSSFADNAAFTFGTTTISIGGGVLDDVATNAATENSAAAPRISTNRMQLFQLGDGAGNERRANVTAGNALVVDGSAVTQPVSGTVTANVGTFPDNEPFNVAQINGVAPLMGNGITGTGSQRVTIASDNTAFTVNAAQSGTWTVQPGNTANTTAWLFKISQTTTDNDVDVLTLPSVTIGTFPDNEPINVAQWGGVATLAGNGVTGTGSPRVTPASDSSAIANWGHDAIGTAVPTGATVIAGTDGTNTTVPFIDPCQREARTTFVVDIVTAATTQVAAAVVSEFYFICSVSLFSAGTNNVAIVEDDTSACASPTAGLNGGVTAAEGYNFTAQTGIVTGTGTNYIMRTATANRFLCIITSAAVQLSGTITYVSNTAP